MTKCVNNIRNNAENDIRSSAENSSSGAVEKVFTETENLLCLEVIDLNINLSVKMP